MVPQGQLQYHNLEVSMMAPPWRLGQQSVHANLEGEKVP